MEKIKLRRVANFVVIKCLFNLTQIDVITFSSEKKIIKAHKCTYTNLQQVQRFQDHELAVDLKKVQQVLKFSLHLQQRSYRSGTVLWLQTDYI